MPINGNIIKTKAEKFGAALGEDNFKASNGWLRLLQKRSSIKWRCLTGDAAEVDPIVAAEWVVKTLKPLLSRYQENDIYNGDETAFFYKCLPGKYIDMV